MTSLTGSGNYDLKLLLNAAVEEEQCIGTVNNTVAAAEDLGLSSIALQVAC